MYIPWVGYFGMMQQADVFVFHDDIKFVRQSWQRRNKIKVPESNGGTKWLTVPVLKNQGQAINDVKINENVDWQAEHWSEIKKAYSKDPIPYGSDAAAYFEGYSDTIRQFYDKNWKKLSDFTKFTVNVLAEEIGVGETEILNTSDMDISGTKTERVIDILQTIGADEYVSGPGAKDYIDVKMFESHDIDLYWHDFEHPKYEQPYGEFESHMSAIDFLFNTGSESNLILREAEEDCLELAERG
jgi:hypothetical protein